MIYKIKGGRVMSMLGRARAIFDDIDNAPVTVEEKGLAIRMVLDMETHNSVTKACLLSALNWLWNQHFEFEEDE